MEKDAIRNKPSRDLVEYVEGEILPEYGLNDAGHGPEHAGYVIRRSLAFAEKILGADPDIVYAAAAYHDVAVHTDRKSHDRLGAERVKSDRTLLGLLGPGRTDAVANAVAQHRASFGNPPDSVYGRILSSADRTTDVDDVLRRTYAYRKQRHPEWTLEESSEDARVFLTEKYGPDGYAVNQTFFPDPDYESFLSGIAALVPDAEKFLAAYGKANGIPARD